MDLSSVWQTFSSRLRNHLMRKVPHQDVEDLLQEVFLALIRNPPPASVALPAWLWALVRNHIANYYRRRPELTEPLTIDVAQPENCGVNEVEAEVAGWLRGMVSSLPPKYRQPLIMADFEGASMRNIAHATGLSVSGAKSRVQRGRIMLGESLKACCAFHLDDCGHVAGWRKRNQISEVNTCCDERSKKGYA